MPPVVFTTPSTLYRDQVRILRAQLPGLFDGAKEAVHEARVATRRIRELLPLVGAPGHDVEQLQRAYKRVGRALGEVRDQDILIDSVASLERRVPQAGTLLVTLRRRHEHKRQSRARRLIKTLERVGATELLRTAVAAPLAVFELLARTLGDGPSWRHTLKRIVQARAGAADASIAHATGVYFPRRNHEARIAIKKFRYAIEIAAATGAPVAPHALKTLKRAQDVLGVLHDRQVLLDELDDDGDKPPADGDQIVFLCGFIEAEMRSLHGEYVGLRAPLLEVCRREEVLPAARTLPTIVAAAGTACAVVYSVIALRRPIDVRSRPEPAAQAVRLRLTS
jgi:CHAD domain-containing protein